MRESFQLPLKVITCQLNLVDLILSFEFFFRIIHISIINLISLLCDNIKYLPMKPILEENSKKMLPMKARSFIIFESFIPHVFNHTEYPNSRRRFSEKE